MFEIQYQEIELREQKSKGYFHPQKHCPYKKVPQSCGWKNFISDFHTTKQTLHINIDSNSIRPYKKNHNFREFTVKWWRREEFKEIDVFEVRIEWNFKDLNKKNNQKFN